MKLIVLLALLFCQPAFATVYQQSDSGGNVLYSDNPVSDHATQVKDLNGNKVKGIPMGDDNKESVQTQLEATTAHPYTIFKLLSPTHQDTLQNQPSLTMTFAIDPNLKEGDKIQAYLDGEPWGNPVAANQLTFTIPYRGTHHIYATLLDSNGKVLMKTDTHEIYVHQAHLGNKPHVNPFPDRR